MSNCVSTKEINEEYYFKVGITKHTIDYKKEPLDFFVYRPMVMASKEDVIIHMPGRNGNAKEYIQQTTFMNTYNTKLSVVIDMTRFNPYEFEYGNLFPESNFDTESGCLKSDAVLNPSSEWTFNVVFHVLDYVKDKLKKDDIKYTLNGIDAAGLFVNYFGFFFPLIENERKQLPEKSIIGVSSFYFFPFSKARMKIDYIKDYDDSKTATKTYKELINYKCIKKELLNCKNTNLVDSLENKNALAVYYDYVNNFMKYFGKSINPKVKNTKDTEVYDLGDLPRQIFPIGTKHVPLSDKILDELANSHTKQKILFQFYEKDTNLYGGVTDEGKNIPNLTSPCNAESTGLFRLFRGMNSYFSSKIDAKEFNWDYVVIPSCGHSSNFANQTILMSNAVDPEFWKNPRFCPQYFYFLKPELFDSSSMS